jgi:hypothetical protein
MESSGPAQVNQFIANQSTHEFGLPVFTKHYLSDQVKDGEMKSICRTRRGLTSAYKYLVAKPEEKRLRYR